MRQPHMAPSDALDRGRDAFSRSAWGDAYAFLSEAERSEQLGPTDLELLARVAGLTGRDAESGNLLARAHQQWLDVGEFARAARCAFWLAMALFERGEMAQGGGWLARAEHALEGSGECVERGYLLVPVALQRLEGGDPGAARAIFREAADVAARFRDPDLAALAQLGHGLSLIALGEPMQGMALLDETMVAVTAGEVSPFATGI